MPRSVGAKDVAPKIRGAFMAAIREGKADLHKLMAEHLNNDFLATLNTISKFIPKEHLHDVEEGSALANILQDISGSSLGLPKPVDDDRPGIH